MKKSLFTILFISVLSGLASYSAAECPDLLAFFKEVDPAQKTWEDLYQLYSKYQECDDGIYGEGFSDFVVQSLAKYWNRFDELASVIEIDPSFQSFVLKHIDATTDLQDLNLLSENVRQHCPSSSILFCREMEKAAIEAIESIRAMEKIRVIDK